MNGLTPMFRKFHTINWFFFYSLLFVSFFLVAIVNAKNTTISIASVDNISFNDRTFFKILFNNFILGATLLFGFVFFNIYNLVVVMANGIMWGLTLSNFISKLGVLNALVLFVPHALIEFYWIISISVYSTYLTKYFYDFLSSDFENKQLFYKIFTYEILRLFTFIVPSALVENYISVSFFNIINSRI